MAMLPLSAAADTGAFRFMPDAPSRALQLLSDELNRAFAAARRYDELRTGQASDLDLRDRGSKARQVFVDMYAGE